MTQQKTSDPYCNAVMKEWDRARATGDRQTQDLFLALSRKHEASSIDWRRVADDAGIEVTNPISEDRAIALQDALTGLVYEIGRIIDRFGSTDLLAAYNHARSLLNSQEAQL